jgi:hypothetical protein
MGGGETLLVINGDYVLTGELNKEEKGKSFHNGGRLHFPKSGHHVEKK